MAYSLRVGNVGLDVKKMQYYLNEILNEPGLQRMTEDGIYGQKTEFAVVIYQYLNHMNIDGIIGTQTWNNIIASFKALQSAAPETNKSSRILSVGSQGLGVQKFQEYLNALVTPVPLLITDGNYGSKTRETMQAFQAMHGLKADGILGSTTWDKVIQLI